MNISKPKPDLFWAANDKEAIELAQKKSFDLVFMDIGLKDSRMNGIELTQYIRKDLQKSWPIVVFSISRSEDDQLQAQAAGADHYMTKPYGYMEMMLNLGQLLGMVSRGESLKGMS